MKQIQQELWPVTLGEARAHRYATWEKSRGYRYQEGDCTVAVDKGPWPSNALAASTNATRPFAASMANRPGRGRRAGGNRLRSSLYPAWPELEAACRDLQSADSMSALPWPRGADVAGGDSEVPGLRMGRLLASIAERVRGDSDSAGGLRARTADVQRAGECGMSHDRGGSDQGGNPPRRPLAGGRAWWKGVVEGVQSPPAWSRPVTTALWGSSVCQGRS